MDRNDVEKGVQSLVWREIVLFFYLFVIVLFKLWPQSLGLLLSN